MNVIRNVKDSANKRSIDNYGRIADTAMSEYQSQYLKYPDSIDQLEIEYVGSVIECDIRRINPDKTIYLSECKVNGKKVLDKSTEDGYYHYGTLVLTNEEYVDKLGKNIEVALKDYYEENNKYPVNYRLLNLPKLDKDVNCVSEIHPDGTVYLTKCSIDGSYIVNENEEDGYYHYGKTMYDYFDNDGNGYIEVEYLESTGTQYIDTGILLPFTIDIKAMYTNFKSNDNVDNHNLPTLFSSQNFQSPWNATYIRAGSSYGGSNCLGSGVIKNIVNDFNIHNYKFSCFSNLKKIYVDNNLIESQEISSNYITYSTYLFAMNSGGKPIEIMNGKIYYVRLYSDIDGKNLIHNFIPVIDSSERPCLFDKVEKKCYYNQGTGEFLYG